MRAITEVGKIGHKFLDITPFKHIRHDKKNPLRNKKMIVRGAVGLVLLAGAVAVVTPIVKAQFQQGEIGNIEMVGIQQNTADFVKLNTMTINYANATLSDIYAYIESGFSEEKRAVLVEKKYGLLEYKNQLSPSNRLFLPASENTIQKVSILLSAIDNFLDHPTSTEEDMVKLNLYTAEYKKATEKEQGLLITLLNSAGINYETLPNGQIKISYLEMVE